MFKKLKNLKKYDVWYAIDIKLILHFSNHNTSYLCLDNWIYI